MIKRLRKSTIDETDEAPASNEDLAVQAARARKAEYQTAVIPIREIRDEMRASVARLSAEQTELKDRLKAFEQGKAQMEDAEYTAGHDRLRLLSIRLPRAERMAQKAQMDLSLFYTAAQEEIKLIQVDIIRELEAEYLARRARLEAEFRAILTNLNS